MARRRRSYRANSDKLLSTAFNNYLVASEKKKKAESRERAKSAREYERSAARRTREKEAQLKKAIREEAKRAKARERELAATTRAREVEARKRARANAAKQNKIDAIVSRLSLELSNRNFLLVEHILEEMAEKCLEASITPAKAYKVYVAPRENEFRTKMIDTFLDVEFSIRLPSMIPESDESVFSELQNKQELLRDELHALSNSEQVITDLMTKATELETYSECLALVEKIRTSIDSEIKKREQLEAQEREEAEKRKQSRSGFLIAHRLDIFEEDLELVKLLAEAEDVDGSQVVGLQDYIEGKARKSSYVEDLKERLGVFMGGAGSELDATDCDADRGSLVHQSCSSNSAPTEIRTEELPAKDRQRKSTNAEAQIGSRSAKQKTVNGKEDPLSQDLSTGSRKTLSVVCLVLSTAYGIPVLLSTAELAQDESRGGVEYFIITILTGLIFLAPAIGLFWASRRLRFAKKTS